MKKPRYILPPEATDGQHKTVVYDKFAEKANALLEEHDGLGL